MLKLHEENDHHALNMDGEITCKNVKDAIAKNLRFLTEREKCSDSKIAADIGVSESSFSGYKNGKTLAPVDKLMAIAQKFEVTLSDLVSVDIEKIGDQTRRRSCQFFCGSYVVHYFNASQKYGDDTLSSHESVTSGVVLVREKKRPTGEVVYPALGVFGIDMVDVAGIKQLVDEMADCEFGAIEDALRDAGLQGDYHETVHGELSVNGGQATLMFSDESNRDTIIVLPNMSQISNKATLRCAIGVMASISHGSGRYPYAQKIIVSSVPLTRPICQPGQSGSAESEEPSERLKERLLDSEGLAEMLRVGVPEINLDANVQKIKDLARGLFEVRLADGPPAIPLPSECQDKIIAYHLEAVFSEAVAKNCYRNIRIDDDAQDFLYKKVNDIGEAQGAFVRRGK